MHLFVSYARKDGMDLADKLHRDLTERGYDTWIDRPEIRGGEDWALTIEQEIDASDGLLALLTRSAYASRICRGEQARALRKGKLVVPLLVQEDADRPIYLEGAHYILFAPPREYAQALDELVSDLRAQRGLRWDAIPERTRQRVVDEERIGILDPLASWASLQAGSARHTQKLLDDLAGTAQSPGAFDPRLFVERVTVEQTFGRFLSSADLAFVLIGDAGVGKTNVLCRWASDRLMAGDAVFLYAGGGLMAADLGRRLSEDLSWDGVLPLRQMLLRLDTLAAEAGRKCLLIVDGINDYTGRDGADPAHLLGHVNDLVHRLPGSAVRVVLSCSAATWHRLDRQDALKRLHWSRFHRPDGERRPLALGSFTPGELETAYARYRDRFALGATLAELPVRVREALRQPLLLRLLAESHAGTSGPITEGSLETGVYRRYWDQCIRRTRDHILVEQIAEQMYMRRRAALSLQDLAGHPTLGPEVLADDRDSSFQQLVESGVLAVTRGDLYTDDAVRFTHATIGAYALARHLRRQPQPVLDTVTALLGDADVFPLAWETAQAILLLDEDVETFAQLAGSQDGEKRELAAEALCRLHAIKAEVTRRMLSRLVDSDSDEARRTALRTAYGIGPATRDLFIRSAMRGSPELRQAAKDTLYLIWRQAAARRNEEVVDTLYAIWRRDARFVYGLLNDLLERVRLRDLISLRNTLEFIIDLSVTIYINHCERPDVIEQTASLYYDLAVNRLRLPKVSLGDALESVILRVLATVFSGRILRWMLFTDAETPERLFHLSKEERVPLARIGHLLDPQTDPASGREDLKDLLQHEMAVMNGAAALVLAVHSTADFPRAERLHRALFADLTPHGRVWQLFSFSVLYPNTPASWIELLEEFTRDLLEQTPESLDNETALDLFSVPLGLAYAKDDRPMRLYDEWLQDGLNRDDRMQIRAVLSGLGAVGFYFPDAVFQMIRPFMSEIATGPSQPDVLRMLATMRTLHIDAVDAFVSNAGVHDSFRRQVVAAADPRVVHRYVTLLGFYNNAVHFSVFYPRMRRVLSAGALTLLADADSAPEFIAAYAKSALQLFRDADFRLIEWTRPDAG